MLNRTLIAPLAAEVIGTFLFFVVGGGAVIADAQTGGAVGLLGIALAHGFALAALATAFGPISGGQFNPAITIALWLIGRIRTVEGLRYIAAQLVGAVGAGLALKLAFGGFDGEPSVYGFAGGAVPTLSMGAGTPLLIGVEAVLTAVLAFAVLLTAVDNRGPKIGALFIGFAVTADIIVGAPLTGAAMNPARWFCPALVFGDLSGVIVYTAGPIIGATFAALSVRYLFAER